MICPGCYKQHAAEGYCYDCRKKVFDGQKVSPILDFDEPKADNLAQFQEKTKRLSISGVQLKYSLKLEKNKLVLTDKGGQYILKPVPPTNQIAETGQAPENEHLTMQLAKQVFGMDTAENALIYFKDGAPAYITKRFDVRPDGTKHQQEDMCQVLGRSRQVNGENFKYDGNYLEIAEAIKKYVAAYPAAIENLFRQIVFNYLFSNGDAHLKNFSLIRADKGDYILSPAYDLMSTVIHTPGEEDTALDLYPGSFDGPFHSIFGLYGQAEFRELATRAGINFTRLERLLTFLLTRGEEVGNFIERSFLREDIKAIYLDNYRNKLSRMGMTGRMIRNYTFPGLDAPQKPLQSFEVKTFDNKILSGQFIETDQSIDLRKENKYVFLETAQRENYESNQDVALLTIMEGGLITGIKKL